MNKVKLVNYGLIMLIVQLNLMLKSMVLKTPLGTKCLLLNIVEKLLLILKALIEIRLKMIQTLNNRI
jgi:hypothetical protein